MISYFIRISICICISIRIIVSVSIRILVIDVMDGNVGGKLSPYRHSSISADDGRSVLTSNVGAVNCTHFMYCACSGV